MNERRKFKKFPTSHNYLQTWLMLVPTCRTKAYTIQIKNKFSHDNIFRTLIFNFGKTIITFQNIFSRTTKFASILYQDAEYEYTSKCIFCLFKLKKKKKMGTPSWRVAVESWLLWIINRTKYYDFCRGHKTLAFISIKLLTFVVFEKMVILEIAEVIWPYLPTIYSLSKAIEYAEIIQIIGDIFPTSTDYYRIWKRLGYVMKEKFSRSYHKGDPYIIWLVYILSLTRIVFYSYFHVELR